MIRLGTSLFSLTNEWLSRHYTLEQLVAAVAERGLGPGLEIVGFQSLRSFPAVEEGAASAFRALLERHELEPSCLGSNLDVALRVDRLLTEDEQVDYLAAQIEVARRLGFPVMRVQHRGSTEVLERALPLAERADVRLGVEIHAPLAADHPSVALVVEVIERLGSPHLGLIPDWSATMSRLPAAMLDKWRRKGLPAEAAERLEAEWRRDGPPHERYDAFAAFARELGAAEPSIAQARLAFTMCGHADPASWRDVVSHVVHVHAKFYDVDESLADDAVPHEELLRILADGGYDGYVSSEWEGSAFFDLHERDGFEQVRRHHALCRRLLGAA